MKKGLQQLIEKFHDKNPYFLPLILISIILLLTGVNYLGPLTATTKLNFDRTYLFSGEAYIMAVTLMPGWVFQANVLTTKPVNLSIVNIDGLTIANSTDHTMIKFVAPSFNTYFLRLEGSGDYALFDFSYSKAGYGPYPIDYALFCTGLVLMLLTFTYYLIKPLKFKFKRALNAVDSIFYPSLIICASIVFWVFVNASIWFYVMDAASAVIMAVIISAVIIISSFILLKKKLKPTIKFIAGYVVSFFTVYLLLVIKHLSTVNISELLVFIAFIGLLILYYYSRERSVLLYYSLVWFVSAIIKLGIYSIGLPLYFDITLSMPVTWAFMPAVILIDVLAVIFCYFIIRAYYGGSIKSSLEYGLYSSIFINGVLQLMTASSIML